MKNDSDVAAQAVARERTSSARSQTRILHALRAEPGLSKVGLSRMLGINSGTMTVLINDLIDRELVVAGDYEPAIRGRRAQRLSLNPERPLALGVFLRSSIRMGIVNLHGKLVASEELPLLMRHGRADFEAIVDRARGMVSDYDVAGVGLAMLSQVDQATGTVVHSPAFGYDEPVVAPFERALGVPAVLARSVEAALMAEDWWGSAPSGDPLVFVTAGPRFVVATKINGQLLRGASNRAGRLGHTIVDPTGPQCARCGNPGCLSVMASNASLVDLYHELHRVAGSATDVTDSRQTLDSVIAARHEDPLARGVLDRAADYLGRGLVTLIDLINPKVIVVSGELMDAESIVLPRVRDVVRAGTLGGSVVELVSATHHGDAVLVGAGALAFERLFFNPR